MKLYKTLLSLTLLTGMQITSSYASYTVIYPLDDINFKNKDTPVETWSAGEDIISDWVYGPKTCTNWSPATNTKPVGVSFDQTADDCNVDKTRTIQHTEISNLGNKRNIGDLITESESETNQSDTRSATGIRFTHTLQIAHYFGWGTTHYYGYFAPVGSYSSFERYDPTSLTPATINGQQIEYLADQDGVTIFRTINGIGLDVLINYNITVNGKTCSFHYNDETLPVTSRILVAGCISLRELSGQTVQVDISPK